MSGYAPPPGFGMAMPPAAAGAEVDLDSKAQAWNKHNTKKFSRGKGTNGADGAAMKRELPPEHVRKITASIDQKLSSVDEVIASPVP